MDLSHPLASDGNYSIPELMGSSYNKTVAEKEDDWYQTEKEDVQIPIHAVLLDDGNEHQPCRLLESVVDNCYKSRFYARLLEFYLLDNDPKLFENVRCPMANCKQGSFASLTQMLRHLKNCDCFPQGLYKCPVCDRIERFETTSRKKCSWFRPTYKEKLQNAIRPMVNNFRNFTHPHSESKQSSAGGRCKECGHLKPTLFKLQDDQSPWPKIPDDSDSTSSTFDASMFRVISEVPVTPELLGRPVFRELHSDELHSDELHVAIAPQELGDTILPPDPKEMPFHGTSHIIDYSGSNEPSLSNPATKFSLSSDGSAGSPLKDVSPTSTETSKKSQDCHAQHGLPANYPPVHDGNLDAFDAWANPNDVNYMGKSQSDWSQPSSTRLHDAIATDYTTDLGVRGQPGPRNGRGIPLNVQTNPEPSSAWFNSPFFYNDALKHRSIAELPVNGNVLSLPNPETCLNPCGDIESVQTTPSVMLHNSPSLPGSGIQSSTSTQFSSLGPSEESLVCPYEDCNYVPTGKKGNFKSYLRKHKTTHEKNAKYKCEQCDRFYTRSDNRDVHARKAHALNDCKRRRASFGSSGREERKTKRISYDVMGRRASAYDF